FPEIALRVRDGHKLRGYFGELFREHSPLLHNHFDEPGSDTPHYRYAYPLVQYKVLHKTPTLVGLGDGAQLLVELFLRIKELNIEGKAIPVLSKRIEHRQFEIGISNDLHAYRFETLWLGLNQKNYRAYQNVGEEQKASILKSTAIANIL